MAFALLLASASRAELLRLQVEVLDCHWYRPPDVLDTGGESVLRQLDQVVSDVTSIEELCQVAGSDLLHLEKDCKAHQAGFAESPTPPNVMVLMAVGERPEEQMRGVGVLNILGRPKMGFQAVGVLNILGMATGSLQAVGVLNIPQKL